MALLRSLARLWALILGCTALALTLAVVARMLIPLTPLAATPSLVDSSPPDGAADVLPATPITLRFSTPMNPAAVAAALRLDPPTPSELRWSDDGATLTVRPSVGLRPGTVYTLSLSEAALGRWWRPLAQPVQIRFRTVPQPAVEAALPATAGTPSDTALAVVFSQPMVPPTAVGSPIAQPEITLSPPTPLASRWLDQRTLLLRPTAPLTPATRYSVTIDPALADLRGVALGAPFSWSFTTGWPALLDYAPADGARWVSPRAPLALRLDAPLDPALLRQALRITPAITGELATATLGSTQVITFTPNAGWAYGERYTVDLVEPPGSALGVPPAMPWEFEVEPRPRLLAFFPGQGQLLAPGQPIRLVFSTPMDEAALRAGLRIEPPVDQLPISVAETEVRLAPELRPSTLYTITIDPATLDRSGEPLGTQAQVRLRTTPALPALSAPSAFEGIVTLPVSRTAAVELATTNLFSLELTLFQLDQPTLLRALALGPEQRGDFQPERYGQPLLRAWSLSRTAPLDQPAPLVLPVGLNDGEPLAPGAYFLRVTSPEGPQAELLLLVTNSRLTLRQGASEALLWATDGTTGAPLPGLPLALYSGGALLGRGVTGSDGTLVQPLPAGAELIAVAEAGGPAVVRGAWAVAPAAAAPRDWALLFTDRLSYTPGDTVQLLGLARRAAPEGGLALPAADTPCRIQLRSDTGTTLTPSAACAVDPATGAVSGRLALPPRMAPGAYSLEAQVGNHGALLTVRLAPPTAPATSLDGEARPSADSLRVQLRDDGLPLAGTTISWSLRLEPLAVPAAPAGFVLDAPAPGEPRVLFGEATTDDAGALTIGPLDGGGPLARRYLLSLGLSAGDTAERIELAGLLPPAQPLVAVSLPSRLVPSDRRSQVQLLALDGLGQPVSGARIALEVFPVAGGGGAPLLVRQASADDDGRASVQLVQLRPGEYELVARAGAGPASRSRLWVYGARFAGWQATAGQVAVIADRASYAPGDVATLLVAAPTPQTTLLLSIERGGLLETQTRSLRAGQVITLPITADMAPGVAVGALVSSPDGLRSGSTTIAVRDDQPPLQVTLDAGAANLLPASTATLTVTTSAGGAPVPADLLVTIAPDLGELPLPVPDTPGPIPFSTAVLAPGAGEGDGPGVQRQSSGPVAALSLDGGAGSPGVTVGNVALPAGPGRWQIRAYAFNGAERVAVGSTVVTTSLPLAYSLVGPPALRAGDSATVELLVRNTSPVTREIRATMSATGLAPNSAATGERLATLGPGGATRFSWPLAPAEDARRAAFQLSLATPGLQRTISRELPVVVAQAAPLRGRTIVATGPLTATLGLTLAPTDTLRLALAPSLRAALADQATSLAALTAPGVDDSAALTLIAAGLAQADGERRAEWVRLTRAGLAALDAAQNPDGGWGWWPGTPSEAFVTAFVLEAQAAARGALGDSRPPSLRGITQLERTAATADPDTRAYIAYVQRLVGRPATGAAALLDGPLAADGLAFLALALPPAQAGPALDQLSDLATHATATAAGPPTVGWTVAAPGLLPRSETAVSAAAVQALNLRRPTNADLPGARRALLLAWGVDGWPSGYEAARVAAALLDANTPERGPRRVLLADQPVIGGDAPLTATQRVELPAAALGSRPALSVEGSSEGLYLLAASAGAMSADTTGVLAVAQELIDPRSGAPIDPANISLGQVVAVRITVVSARPQLRADLVVPLPAGLEPLPLAPRAPFRFAGGLDPATRTLTLGAANIAPGAHTQIVLARAVAAGSFTAPPARLTVAYSSGLSASATAGLSITISR